MLKRQCELGSAERFVRIGGGDWRQRIFGMCAVFWAGRGSSDDAKQTAGLLEASKQSGLWLGFMFLGGSESGSEKKGLGKDSHSKG